MHKLEFVTENEMHKILWDFEIQIHLLIPARRPDVMIIGKKKKLNKKKRRKKMYRLVDFAVPADQRERVRERERERERERINENEKREKY